MLEIGMQSLAMEGKLPGDEDLERERWLPIDKYPGYDVSDYGRVRSWWALGGADRTPRLDSRWHLMGLHDRSGYLRVHLRDARGKTGFASVNCLVLEAFIGPRPDGAVSCHYPDPDKTNNRLENLRWDTRSANAHDMLRGNHSRGQKVNADELPEIWARLVDGEPLSSVAKRFNISISTACSIRNYKTWSHITRALPGVPPGIETGPVAIGPVFAPSEILGSPNELWRSLDDWSCYRISSRGRLLSRWPSRGKRGMLSWEDARILEPHVNRAGYAVACLTDPGGAKRCVQIHALVLTAFAGPRPGNLMACHGDGDRLNNHIANLRWDTASGNAIDKSKHGTSPSVLLNCEDVKSIRIALESGEHRRDIAERYGVSHWTIQSIKLGHNWKHVV